MATSPLRQIRFANAYAYASPARCQMDSTVVVEDPMDEVLLNAMGCSVAVCRANEPARGRTGAAPVTARIMEMKPRYLGAAGKHLRSVAQRVQWPVNDPDSDYD